jgi:hypothetical protein
MLESCKLATHPLPAVQWSECLSYPISLFRQAKQLLTAMETDDFLLLRSSSLSCLQDLFKPSILTVLLINAGLQVVRRISVSSRDSVESIRSNEFWEPPCLPPAVALYPP